MSAVISISTGKAYGVSRVCRIWGLSRASVYRDLQPASTNATPRCRPGPQGPMSDAELTREIRQVITDSKFHGEGHRKILGAPALQGHSHLKGAGFAAHARERAMCEAPCQGPAHGPRAHDGTIIPDGIDERPRDVGART